MRRYLRLLPACLYVRLVRRHGERVTVKGMVYAWDGGDILVRIRR